MPVQIDVKQPKEAPHIIAPERFQHQSKIDDTERWRSGSRFGELSPATLTSILQEAGEQGKLTRWADLCEWMVETDSHLASLHSTRISRVVQAPRRIVPGTHPDPRRQSYAEQGAKFIGGVIDAIENWDTYMTWFLGALGRGYSASEYRWERNVAMNAMVVTGFRFAHPHRFQWGEDWDLRLYEDGRKDGNTYGQALTPDNWLVHIAGNEGTYPGKAGYFRGCSWPWLYKIWFKKFYAHGVEVNGSPYIYAIVPNEAKASVMDQMVTALENMSYDTVGAFREGTDINTLQGANIGDGSVYTKAIETADAQQTKLILGAEDIVTPGLHGSQSAVETRTEETLDPRTVSDAKRLANDLRSQLFEPLCRLNKHLFGGTIPAIPEMAFGGDAAEDAQRVPEVRSAEPQQPETDDIGELSPDEMAAIREMRREARGPKARAGATPLTVSVTGQTSKPCQNPLGQALSGKSANRRT
jgi:phage gp29-like protein